MTKSLLLLIAILNSSFLLYSQTDNVTNNMIPLYFESPEKAIPEISKLLMASDWKTLSRYYDLKDSEVKIDKLLSGEFFIRKEKPDIAHPAGFWKYKHPFAPGFKFKQFIEMDEPGIVEVTVNIEIDQGGGMIQEGFRTFLMRKSEMGFQVMPGKSSSIEISPEIP